MLCAAAAAAAQDAVPAAGKVVATSEAQAATVRQADVLADVLAKPFVSDAERAAVAIVDWDLDLHLVPATAGEECRAQLQVRNVSGHALKRLALEISSTLRWQAVSSAGVNGLEALPFTQSPIATDADHTGYAQEVVIALAHPLAAGATLPLVVLYAGSIPHDTGRLELLGTDPARARQTDWDAITPTSDAESTSLRGFGNVLWYPVAAPAALLGDGNKLFELVSRQRRLDVAATMRLRLTVEYAGDPPDAAILNGRLEPLLKAPDEQTTLIDQTQGLATAEFARMPVGFRVPSLFLTGQHATASPGQLLSVVTYRPDAAEPYVAAGEQVKPLLAAWLGEAPLRPLVLLDHAGEPYEDAAFLAAQLAASALPEAIAPSLVRALAHAWFRAPGAANVWLDEGMADFMSLLWVEREQGRTAALAELGHAASSIALAEPGPATPGSAGPGGGQPLTGASADVYLRVKAASVLWQLRDIVGEEPFRTGLMAYRRSLALSPELARDPKAFEQTLEHAAGHELGWFFDDWVYSDPGLPDLTIVQVNPRRLPARPDKNGGYLVAVEVRNDGDAVAEVPVTVRSGSLTATERLRIGAHASASTRVLFEGVPETVEVNDGSVPELRVAAHSYTVRMDAKP